MNVLIPVEFNYIGVFLTMQCNLKCPYCINHFKHKAAMSLPLNGFEWVTALNRIRTRADLPITLQGGEPTQHPDFYDIVNGIRPETPVDLLTNLQFDIDEFVSKVRPERFMRQSPYASIRVSFHPLEMAIDETLMKVKYLKSLGYPIGIWTISHPMTGVEEKNKVLKYACDELGIDCREKDFLGYYKKKLYGKYMYPDALNYKGATKVMECRTSELIIGETGHVFKCHADLYKHRYPLGNMLDESLQVSYAFKKCLEYGGCQPCDLKGPKFNRFQEQGHCAVTIRSPSVKREE